jgi:hypothetical protein
MWILWVLTTKPQILLQKNWQSIQCNEERDIMNNINFDPSGVSVKVFFVFLVLSAQGRKGTTPEGPTVSEPIIFRTF